MAEPKPNLRLVDPTTGEIVDDHGECHRPQCGEVRDQLRRAEARTRGLDLQIINLRRDLANVQGTDPDSEDVRFVADYWSKRVVEEGWWTRSPQVKPGTDRWTAVRARLRDNYEGAYICTAVDGALADSGRPGFKRAWLDLTSVCRNAQNLERAYEQAVDPKAVRTRNRDLLREFQRLDLRTMRLMAERCGCGCPRLFHRRSDASWEPCLVCGDCADFDGTAGRHAAWLEREMARLRRRP